jgi:hypothetical protein
MEIEQTAAEFGFPLGGVAGLDVASEAGAQRTRPVFGSSSPRRLYNTAF